MTNTQPPLILALQGVTGSGKTWLTAEPGVIFLAAERQSESVVRRKLGEDRVQLIDPKGLPSLAGDTLSLYRVWEAGRPEVAIPVLLDRLSMTTNLAEKGWKVLVLDSLPAVQTAHVDRLAGPTMAKLGYDGWGEVKIATMRLMQSLGTFAVQTGLHVIITVLLEENRDDETGAHLGWKPVIAGGAKGLWASACNAVGELDKNVDAKLVTHRRIRFWTKGPLQGILKPIDEDLLEIHQPTLWALLGEPA